MSKRFTQNTFWQEVLSNPTALRSILDLAEIPINYCSTDEIFLFSNKAHAALHGLVPEQVIGRTISDILGVEANKIIRPYYERVLRGEQIHYEKEVLFNIGLRYIQCIYNPVRDAEGKICGWVGVIYNMTERYQLEKTLRKKEAALRIAKEKAEAASIAKSEFLANMSHELRTPMNAIIGLIDIMLIKEYPVEKRQGFLNVMHTSAQQLMQLINDLLDITKLEAGQTSIEVIPFNLSELLDEVVSINGVQAKQKNIQLLIHKESEFPIFLIGDPFRLKQVLMNLVSNAVKFTNQGNVTIKLHGAFNQIKNALDTDITIIDTGIGIQEDKLENIFNKFTQADSSISRTHGGTGLGLSITKMLVELMQGTLSVQSTFGEGTQFNVHLSLPVANSQHISAAAPSDIKAPYAMGEKVNNTHILLVEDNEANIIVAKALLENYGYTYTVAKNGKEALEKLTHGNFDVVLMDLQMPKIGGFEIVRWLRKKEKEQGNIRHLPVIGMTAHALTGVREECRRAGMDEYISKPFNPHELIKLIKQFSE